MTKKMRKLWLLSGLWLTLAATALATVQNCPAVKCSDGYYYMESLCRCVQIGSTARIGTSTSDSFELKQFEHGKSVSVHLVVKQGSGKVQAKVLGTASGATVTLQVKNFAGQDGAYGAYTITSTGDGRQVAILLGTLRVTNGTGRLTANTPLIRFALVLTKGGPVNEITDKNLAAHSTALKPDIKRKAAPQVNKPKSIR